MRSVISWGAGAVVAAVALVSFLPAQAAFAADPTPYGYDVSWPQCDSSTATTATLPADRPFGVVGLNHGLATSNNPCFFDEFQWALASTGASEQPKAALYVNSGNPALAGTWWPSSNTTRFGNLTVDSPLGTCAHLAGAACAYVYGYSIAHDDIARFKGLDPATASGSGNGLDPAAFTWWLDVETSNTWQSDTKANAASIAGMKAYFSSIGADVGLYSTASQWKTIAGTTSATSVLAGLPSWIAGASTATTAAPVCAKASLTPGGRVSLVQFISGDYDRNYSCHVFASPPVPSFTGTVGVGKTQTAVTGTWADAPVRFTYQWRRNGTPISKATGATYKTTASDSAKNLSVSVTTLKNGFTPLAQSSASKLIPGSLTRVTPTITGTAKVGSKLSVRTGTWGPGTVVLTQQWNWAGTPIPGATGKSYIPTAHDAGHTITVTVTGTKTGYATSTATSASVKPKP